MGINGYIFLSTTTIKLCSKRKRKKKEEKKEKKCGFIFFSFLNFLWVRRRERDQWRAKWFRKKRRRLEEKWFWWKVMFWTSMIFMLLSLIVSMSLWASEFLFGSLALAIAILVSSLSYMYWSLSRNYSMRLKRCGW